MTVTAHDDEHRSQRTPDGSRWRTVVHGLVGGAAAVILSFLPLSTLLGGAVGGYLERGHDRRGAGAGAIAGLVAAVPYAVVGAWLAIAGVSLPGPDIGLAPGILVTGAVVIAVAWTVAMGVAGGLLGGYLHAERHR